MIFNIIIAGVGGQGTVLASRILAQTAVNSGLFARTAENIGMAQREGCVQSHVRIGQQEFGPLITDGNADLMLAFEPAEAVRSLYLLKPGGAVLVNETPIDPVTVALGRSSYDKPEVLHYLKEQAPGVKMLPAFDLAVAAGNFKTANVVMLGAAAGLIVLPFSAQALLQTLLENLPKKLHDVNKKAFELGIEAVS
jgi:indolepyruvate ferredoxin oxidoreductase beta subunit